MEQNNQSIFKYQLTAGGTAIVAILLLSLIALGERVLYDIGRWVSGSSRVDYFDDLNVIIAHGVFIISLLIVSILINMLVTNKEKYAMALIPYFVLSIVLSLQLALQVTIYFANHHTKFQLYLVLIALSVVCTVAIYFIQKKFHAGESNNA